MVNFIRHIWVKERAGALLDLSSWCLVMVMWLFLAVPLACLQIVIVVFPDHTIFFTVSDSND